MTDSEIKHGFLQLESQHPFFQALLALLDNEVATETQNAVQPDLTDGARHFNAGRLANARDIRAAVEGVMTDALAETRAELARREQLAQRKKEGEEG